MAKGVGFETSMKLGLAFISNEVHFIECDSRRVS